MRCVCEWVSMCVSVSAARCMCVSVGIFVSVCECVRM